MALYLNIKANNQRYRIKTENRHLKNLYNDNYYIELGVIPSHKMGRLLKNQVLNFDEICDHKLAVEGIGQITNDLKNDLEYQLLFLMQMRQKSSSNKLFITCNVLKYRDALGRENFAPIILIPIDFDYHQRKLIKSGPIFINEVLISELQVYLKEAIILPDRLTTLDHIYNCTIELCKKTNLEYRLGHYLTFGGVEYLDRFKDPEEEFFNVQRSIYEMSSTQIYQKYFTEIKAVLPTNVQQKHVLLKAANNDNFVVNGRYGTGKTATIINILADKIAKGSKVLYVNQDMNNIAELLAKLDSLDLGSYVENLGSFQTLITSLPQEDKNIIFTPSEDMEYDQEIISNLSAFEAAFNQKIHGFRYQAIANSLMILRNTNPHFDDIKIEASLENQEVNHNYQCLKEIESLLKVVDPLVNNVWRRFENFYTEKNSQEVETALVNYCNQQIKFNQYIKQFTTKFNLKLPENTWELHRLINNLGFFRQIAPPSIWVNETTFNKAAQNIEELIALKNRIKELEQTYLVIVTPNYQLGLAEKVLEVIKHPLLVSSNEASFNRLLADDQMLKDKVTLLENHRNLVRKYHQKMLYYFNVNEINLDLFTLLTKLQELFKIPDLNQEWFEDYAYHFEQHYRFNVLITKHYNRYQILLSEIEPYINRFDKIRYDYLAIICKNKNVLKSLKNQLNYKAIKNANLTREDITRNVIRYVDFFKMLTLEFNQYGLQLNQPIELYLKTYHQWIEFISKLSDKENQLFINFICKQLGNNKKIRNNILNDRDFYHQYYQDIADFNAQCQITQDLILELTSYAIVVKGKDIIARVENLATWITYLKKVLAIKAQFISQWRKSDNITYQELVSLATIDQEYRHKKDLIVANDQNYRSCFGDHYIGLDTDCLKLKSLITIFDRFRQRVNSPKHLVAMFNNHQIDQLIASYSQLNSAYVTFYETHRQFGRYFVGGVSHLLDISFDQALKELETYYEKKSQIKPVLIIFEYLRNFENQGLKDLPEQIRNSQYHQNIANGYLYNTLKNYYHEALNNTPILLHEYKAVEWLENYNLFEQNYCLKNLSNLHQKNANKKPIVKTTNYLFNDYNHHVLTEDKNHQIFLANLDIFNSDLDLSLFDLVIIDDCHIASSNKYHRIFECKQMIAFGDESFRYNIHVSVLNQIANKYKINFSKRYLEINPRFDNKFSNNNQFIYNFNGKIEIIKLKDLDSIANLIINNYQKQPQNIINVVFLSNSTKRKLYMAIVNKLNTKASINEIKPILINHIRFVSANHECCSTADQVIFLYDDIMTLDINKRLTIMRNFALGSSPIGFTFIDTQDDQKNDEIRSEIIETVGPIQSYQKQLGGANKIIIDYFQTQGIEAIPGFGRFDVVIYLPIKQIKVGIIIEGNDASMPYSLVDDYQFYYTQYTLHGWNVFIYHVEELIENLDQRLKEIVELVK